MASKFNTAKLEWVEDGIYQAPIELMKQVIDKGDAAIDTTLETAAKIEDKLAEIQRLNYDDPYAQEVLNKYNEPINDIHKGIQETPTLWGNYIARINDLQRKLKNDYTTGDLYAIKKGYEDVTKMQETVKGSKTTYTSDMETDKAYIQNKYKHLGGAKERAYRLLEDGAYVPIDSEGADFAVNTAKIKDLFRESKTADMTDNLAGMYIKRLSKEITEWNKDELAKVAEYSWDNRMENAIRDKAMKEGFNKGLRDEELEQHIQEETDKQKGAFINYVQDNLARKHEAKSMQLRENQVAMQERALAAQRAAKEAEKPQQQITTVIPGLFNWSKDEQGRAVPITPQQAADKKKLSDAMSWGEENKIDVNTNQGRFKAIYEYGRTIFNDPLRSPEEKAAYYNFQLKANQYVNNPQAAQNVLNHLQTGSHGVYMNIVEADSPEAIYPVTSIGMHSLVNGGIDMPKAYSSQEFLNKTASMNFYKSEETVVKDFTTGEDVVVQKLVPVDATYFTTQMALNATGNKATTTRSLSAINAAKPDYAVDMISEDVLVGPPGLSGQETNTALKSGKLSRQIVTIAAPTK